MNQYKLTDKFSIQKGASVKTYLIILSILFIISYGAFNARNIILGPSIVILNPPFKDTEVNKNTIVIQGKVNNVVALSLNERAITTNQEGFFEEQLLLSPGFNIIELKGRDRFKKEVEETIRVYYKQ